MTDPIQPFSDRIHVTQMDPVTGRFLQRSSCNIRDAQAHSATGLVLMEGWHYGELVWWNGSAVVDRPSLMLDGEKGTVGGTNLRVVNIPNPTPVTVITPTNRYDGTITDGVFEFSGEIAGSYSFEFKPPFPWRELRHEMVLR